MTNYIAGVIAVTTIKIIIIVCGTVLVYLGYKLYSQGVLLRGGDIEGGDGVWWFSFTGAAPGAIFALFGSVVIVIGILRPLEVRGWTGDWQTGSEFLPTPPAPPNPVQTSINEFVPPAPPNPVQTSINEFVPPAPQNISNQSIDNVRLANPPRDPQ